MIPSCISLFPAPILPSLLPDFHQLWILSNNVHCWFCANRLAVNPSKTEYLRIGTNQQRSKIINSSVYFQNLSLTPTDSVRNLGVLFDSNLDFKKHISAICRSAFFQIRQLRQIRSSLDKNSAIIWLTP